MKYILTLEAHYKKRGLIGKAADWISGRKDYKDLIEGQKRLGQQGQTYSIEKENPSELNYVSFDPGRSLLDVIKWVDQNPDKFLVFGISQYTNASYHNFQLIKFSKLIEDILEVTDRRLDIICVTINYISEYEDYVVKVVFREDGWQQGDGMPDDIYNEYIHMIKDGLKKKREKYVKEYNILQSQKTTQKFKYRSIRLYGVKTEYQSKYSDERGLLTVSIDPRM